MTKQDSKQLIMHLNFSQWHLSIWQIINYIQDKTRFQTINYAFKLLTMTFKHMSDNQLYSWQNKISNNYNDV